MSRLKLDDPESLGSQCRLQLAHQWDLEKDIAWNTPIDLSRPLVPLDDDAILFPGSSREQRLAISQMMGLVIAASIFEMEECILRLRKRCWDDIHRALPVSPEFVELGEIFLDEEKKHSTIFRRYVERWAEAAGLELELLLSLLPRVEGTFTERLLEREMRHGGHAFWWIVANVEQEFLLIYHAFRPFRERLDPLYYSLHERHFEEEARHAGFPYLMLELIAKEYPGAFAKLHTKGSLAGAQLVQTMWTLGALKKLTTVGRLGVKHPFLEALAGVPPLLDEVPKTRVLWKILTSAPYVSPLVNPFAHRKIIQFAESIGAARIPFPKYLAKKLVGY